MSAKDTAKSTTKPEEYGADQIVALEGLEPVRVRPGMYIGGTDNRGLHHLVWEIVDNAVDEALAGHCTEIIVELSKDSVVRVIDNGRGIPVAKNSKTGEHAVMMVFEQLHAGGKFGSGGYKVSGGLHGVGASVTNALSEWLEVDVERDGYHWTARWEQGKRKQELKKGDKTSRVGTTVTWKYDPTIFKGSSIGYDPTTIENRLREKSYLVRGLKFRMRVEGQKEKVFYSKNGIAEFVERMASENDPLHPDVLHFKTDSVVVKDADNSEVSLGVEVAMQWTKKAAAAAYSFANVVTTPDAGSHVDGLRTAVSRALNNFAYEQGKLKRDKKDDRLIPNDILAACTVAVSVKLENPQFEGQTKGRLNNGEAKTAVNQFLYAELAAWLDNKKNAKAAKEILERCLHARKFRLAAGKVSKNYNPNSIWADTGQSAKLADCDHTASALEERELFIVEGDSAAGTAKEARDSRTQAILPLRGKVINAITNTSERIFDNAEVVAIITALGGRIELLPEGGNYVQLNPDLVRYHRVILLADADQDGSHIQTLVTGLFFGVEGLLDVVKSGRLFLARPPLYRIKLDGKGEQVAYAYSDEERTAIVAKHKRKGEDVQRFKGLGEMNADQLEETVMDPATRQLSQVSIEDLAETMDAVNLVLGKDANRRRQWLEEAGALKARAVS